MVYTNELRRFKNVGTFEVLQGYQFITVQVLFKQFVHDLYTLRMTDKNGPLGNVCKLLMNSLYGKFGTKPERSKTCLLTFDDVTELVASGVSVESISDEFGVYRVTEEKQANCEHVGIAGTITSEARSRLWEQLDSKTLYCDTDSVHTTNTLATSSDIGKMKLEFSGEGVYCGKKLYALRDTESQKVRAKGIRVGGKLGCKLDFDDLRKVAEGAKIRCTFFTPETANAVVKGKSSCKMNPKTRTIRKTVKV
jgi:hypothetical protein